MTTPQGRDPEGRDPKGRHLPRPHDSSALLSSGRARPVAPGVNPGSGLAVRPCQTRQGVAPGSDLQVCDALVVEHLPFAAKVAANYARRTGHPKEDLEQLAAIGFAVYLKQSNQKSVYNDFLIIVYCNLFCVLLMQ